MAAILHTLTAQEELERAKATAQEAFSLRRRFRSGVCPASPPQQKLSTSRIFLLSK
jgi:hypothetical protein